VLLIEYWKETGQLQNVQVLLAELERQNPDDPAATGPVTPATIRLNPRAPTKVQ
jgi:hypothetical protein